MKLQTLYSVLFVLCCMNVLAIDTVLREVWQYEALSNLYAPPLVADVVGGPQQEIIISDSEARRIRCIDADGNQLWECDSGWKKRLISPAALSNVGNLAIANGDGSLTCIHAADGVVLWKRHIGAVEWGGVLWVALNNTEEERIVAGTEHDGIIAFTAEGDTLWHLKANRTTPSLHIRGPLATANVVGKGVLVFGLSKFGPFCLDAKGNMLWEHYTGDDFPGGPIVVDADNDNKPELYSVSNDDAYLWRFDALSGEPKWKVPLYGKVDTYSASSIAAGDITRNGYKEIVLGDAQGHVYAINHEGILLWTFQTSKAVHNTVSLGDVNGDGRIEVLVVSGDHYMYCLNEQGRLLWRYETSLRLVYPPTLTDLENDGIADIFLCGSDRKLRRLTLNGRYSVSLMPWPMRSYNVQQSGASYATNDTQLPLITREEAVVIYGDFEQGKVRDGLEQFDPDSLFYKSLMTCPRGWRAETLQQEGWGITDAISRTGSHALLINGGMTVSSEPVAITPTWRNVTVAIHAGGGNAQAVLRWIGDYGVIREDALKPVCQKEKWERLELNSSTPPTGTRLLVLALTALDTPVYWDEASLTVTHEEPATFEVLANQVGYDRDAPKLFLVQANFQADNATYEMRNESGDVVFSGVLNHIGRIKGHYGHDWGYEYYSGDFTDCNTLGEMRIKATLDGLTEFSWPFNIGDDLLWQETARSAYRFFYYQRCGMAIPGWHDACHLDDAVGPDGKTQYELWGGWHDAGDYNTYHNAPYVYGLAVAYAQQRPAFDALQTLSDDVGEFFDEILWGGDHTRRMIMADGSTFGHISSGYGFWGPPELETDNLPNTGDERRGSRERGDNPDAHQAAVARIAVLLNGQDAGGVPASVWIETAARSLEYALEQNRRGLWQLSAAIDLFSLTGKEQYRDLATTLFEENGAGNDVSAMRIEVTRRYDAVFDTHHAEELREAVLSRAETMLANAANPFGVYTFGPPDNPNFFNTPADQGGWHVGTSSHLFEAATFMALAYQYEPDPRFLRFVYDQFNWTLGLNPYNVSLMEGAGSANLPSYHHRYAFAGIPRGAVPGGVVNGVTWRSVGDDRPFVDMSGVDIPAYEPNEVWLPHSTNYLNAITQLKTINTGIGK